MLFRLRSAVKQAEVFEKSAATACRVALDAMTRLVVDTWRAEGTQADAFTAGTIDDSSVEFPGPGTPLHPWDVQFAADSEVSSESGSEESTSSSSS